jgi:hypothetical protein
MTKSPWTQGWKFLSAEMQVADFNVFFLFSHQFLKRNIFHVVLYMLLVNKHLKLLFLKLTKHITNFSAPFHMNLMTWFTLSFQANQFTCTVSEKCVLVHTAEPMLTCTTHSIWTTQRCVSTNNKINAFTVKGVKKKKDFQINDQIHPT